MKYSELAVSINELNKAVKSQSPPAMALSISFIDIAYETGDYSGIENTIASLLDAAYHSQNYTVANVAHAIILKCYSLEINVKKRWFYADCLTMLFSDSRFLAQLTPQNFKKQDDIFSAAAGFDDLLYHQNKLVEEVFYFFLDCHWKTSIDNIDDTYTPHQSKYIREMRLTCRRSNYDLYFSLKKNIELVGVSIEKSILLNYLGVKLFINTNKSADQPWSDLTLSSMLLGEGSFGKVIKGIFKGETVAAKLTTWYVKPVKSSHAIAMATKKVALGELAILEQIKHENVLSAKSAIVSKYFCYIVFKMMDCDLYAALFEGRRDLALSQKIMIAQGVISGLQYLLSLGIVHADIKPENILLNTKNEAKISDFGLVSIYQNDDSAKPFVEGTYFYLAPEAHYWGSSEMITFTAAKQLEIYALGVTLWELFTGIAVFVNQKTNERLTKKEVGLFLNHNGGRSLSEHVVSIKQYPPIIDQALFKKPARRPGLSEMKESFIELSANSMGTFVNAATTAQNDEKENSLLKAI